MRKNSLLCSLTAATMMFFASCNNENIPGDNTEVKDATVTISIASTLRAASGTEEGSENENQIKNIEAYTFVDGNLVDYQPVTGNSKVTLNAKSGSVDIAVVANSSIGSVNTKAALEEKLSGFKFTKTTSTEAKDGFVMSTIKNVTLNEGSNQEIIPVKRTVSKFVEPNFEGVKLDLSKVDIETIKSLFPTFTGDVNDIDFEYESFVLANGLNQSLLYNFATYTKNAWPARAGWISEYPTTSETTLTYLNSEFKDDGSYEKDGVYSKDFAKNAVYVHENFPYPDYQPVANGPKGYNAKEVYCFIVKGNLKWNTQVVERYWRINLVKATTGAPTNPKDYYKIFRNGLYQVKVTDIKTIGYDTPKKAEESEDVIPLEGETLVTITVTVDDWDLYQTEEQM